MKKIAICLALGLGLAPTVVSAQVTIQMDKLTCADITAMAPGDQDMVAAWMSGWYNQKLGYTQVDLMAFRQNKANIMKYCADHPKDQLMGVIQASVNQMQKKQ
ncbi:HdeA/HdeB family chaperone [Rhodoblastus sp.]|uniref:HdeA/HdeB family chaperone n=1 Tax=Rhodoblastus sp. TaxID=1962975 RepID=UPI00260702CC|nr:HdeA/HdeB family chaperone [Rhodoblastus sp.]